MASPAGARRRRQRGGAQTVASAVAPLRLSASPVALLRYILSPALTALSARSLRTPPLCQALAYLTTAEAAAAGVDPSSGASGLLAYASREGPLAALRALLGVLAASWTTVLDGNDGVRLTAAAVVLIAFVAV